MSDPLCALYFALGNSEHEGSKKICVYAVDKQYIKNFDSDTVSILSVLTKLKKENKLMLKVIVDCFIEYEKEKNKKFLIDCFREKEDYIKQKYEEIYKKQDININNMVIKKIEELKKEKLKKENKITPNDFFNIFVSVYVHELNWQLKKEIPNWYDNVLDISTFTHCYLVKHKYNNPRVKAQSGAFFIYPFEDTEIKKSLIENGYKIFDFDVINKMKEILYLKQTKYFPDDLTVFAKEVQEKYKNKKEI